jgi:hypothetical protein
MKARHLLYTATGLVALMLLFVVFVSERNEAGAHSGPPPPTAAPPPTPGARAPEPQSVYTTLAQPLDSEDQVLQRALDWDSKWARRDRPLSVDTLKSEPERVEIKWYADRTFNGSEFGPGAELGPVWVVTIIGPVHIHTIGVQGDPVSASVTYTIAQRTGNLLAIDPGPLLSK